MTNATHRVLYDLILCNDSSTTTKFVLFGLALDECGSAAGVSVVAGFAHGDLAVFHMHILAICEPLRLLCTSSENGVKALLLISATEPSIKIKREQKRGR